MFRKKFSVVLVAIILVNSQANYFRPTDALEDYCWSTDELKLQKSNFASKTAYQFVKGDPMKYSNIPGCTPNKFWLISRHGTRLPSANVLIHFVKMPEFRDEILFNYRNKSLNTQALCDEDLDALKNWKWNTNITTVHEDVLTDQGWNDLKWLADSYQKAYPDLLKTVFTNETYLFRHTNKQRCEASFKGFVDGLFGNESKTVPPPLVPSSDKLLMPQDSCESWPEHKATVAGFETETDKFKKSKLFQQIAVTVSERLGFQKQLNESIVNTMYELCRFEQAWYINEDSAWCSVFTPEQIEIFQYAEDLRYYYTAGYGSLINDNISCELVKDMITRLDCSDNKNTVYFTHLTTLQLLLVALGSTKDDLPLLANNFEAQQSRKWKSSQMGPFTTNLAVIKYNCSSEDEPEKALFLYNEQPIDFEWCDNGFCNWIDVKSQYSRFLDNECDDIFCPNNS